MNRQMTVNNKVSYVYYASKKCLELRIESSQCHVEYINDEWVHTLKKVQRSKI